jgi:hypothetical protein
LTGVKTIPEASAVDNGISVEDQNIAELALGKTLTRRRDLHDLNLLMQRNRERVRAAVGIERKTKPGRLTEKIFSATQLGC